MRWLFALVLCLGYLALHGPVAAEPEGTAPTLGSGDKLKLTFYGRTDISGEFSVQAEGRAGNSSPGVFSCRGKDACATLRRDFQGIHPRSG